MLFSQSILPLAAAGLHAVSALKLDVNSPGASQSLSPLSHYPNQNCPVSIASIRSASATIARGLFSYYKNAHVSNTTADWQVGTFPYPPYYWWESGAAWGSVIDYIVYTGDKTYLAMTLDALFAQIGPNRDFVMPQEFWNEVCDHMLSPRK